MKAGAWAHEKMCIGFLQNGDIPRKDLLGRIPAGEREKIFGRLMCMEVCASTIVHTLTIQHFNLIPIC